MNSVFISYRRDVSSFIARAVFQDLRANGVDVFMDIESIDSGQFDAIILNQIAARPYFLLILTPGTLDRCQEPGDWLLRELAQAVNLNRVIIPLVTPNFSFEDANFLPEPLATDLPRFNSVKVEHEWFDEGMVRLRTRFLKDIDLLVVPTPKADQAKIQQKVAQVQAEPLITEQQLSAQAHFEKGLARPTRNLDEKIADYSEAIRLNPQDANTFYRRGIVNQYKNDYEAAIADYSKAIELAPKFFDAYMVRAIAYSDVGDTNSALADYTEAIDINPLNSNGYLQRGGCYYDIGDFNSAIRDFTSAIKINPNTGFFSDRAECYFALGQHEKAAADFKIALALDHSNYSAIAGIALAHYAMQQMGEAKRIWRSLLDIDGRYGDADWVENELNWAKPLTEMAHLLIGEL